MLPLSSHPQLVHSLDLTGQVQRLGERPFALGGFADIYKGFLNGSDTVVAVKVIRCPYPTDPTECGVPKKLRREIKVWSTLNHPHIVPFFGTTIDFDRGYGLPSIVTPYFFNGNVMTYLKTHPHTNKHSIITQLASGLNYLHDRSIVHGDIKGNNILVDDNGSARLADFGLARVLDKSGFSSGTTSCTPRFLAVELSTDSERADHIYDANPATAAGWRWRAVEFMTTWFVEDPVNLFTPQSDVWAFGMVVFEICSGKIPFWDIKCDTSAALFVARGGRPQWGQCPHVSRDFWDLLEKCWASEPRLRPTMSEVNEFLSSRALPRARL